MEQDDKIKPEPNTIKAHHITVEDGEVRVIDEREYCWHIPKSIRGEMIKKGDVVLVKSLNRQAKVIVTDVYRENVEDTGKRYKAVIEKLPDVNSSNVYGV